MIELALPEPAAGLFRKTRSILDRHLTRITPGYSGYALGGGTILAARWGHRRSTDIDVFINPKTSLARLSKTRSPEFWNAMYEAGATRIELHDEFAVPTIEFPRGRIELIPGRRNLERGQCEADVDGSKAKVLSTAQILTGKLMRRGIRPPVRDLYDVSVADTMDRASLTIAVNAMPDRSFSKIISSWTARKEFYERAAGEELLGVPGKYEHIKAAPAQHAADVARANRYTGMSISVSGNRVIVATTNRNGIRQRIYESIGGVREGFDRDGIHAALEARQWNPSEVRQEINNALAVKADKLVLDIGNEADQGRCCSVDRR